MRSDDAGKAGELALALPMRTPGYKRHPDALWAPLRQEHPILRARLPFIGSLWLVTRHEDVTAVLKDHDRFAVDPATAGRSDRLGVPRWLPKRIEAFTRNMASVDEPQHRRLRNIVNQAFSRRRIEEFASTIEGIADRLLDAMAEQTAVDLVAAYTRPLPLLVICELLGVPDDQRATFQNWSRTAVESSRNQLTMLLVLPRLLRIRKHLQHLADTRRQTPGDDVITQILEAEHEGERLSEDEIVAMLLLLVIAGHETTVHTLGSGTLALLEHPEQLAELRCDPAARMPAAAEELFRRESSVEFVNPRYVIEDMELHGQPLRRGEPVGAVLISANYDENVFVAPRTLDLTRSPNPHVTFGGGVHFCLGVQLARIEAQIALTRLITRFPEMQLDARPDDLQWHVAVGLRGLQRLPVRLGTPSAV